MQTDTTTHASRAIIGASPQLAALFAALDQADAASDTHERNVYDPLFRQYTNTTPRPAAFAAALEECARLEDAVTAACDAVADFPASTLADLLAKTQRVLAIGYFDNDGMPEKIVADIARVASQEA